MDYFNDLNWDLELLRAFKELLIVLGIGILLGTEREHSRRVNGAHLFAGVRTFPIVGLIGYLSLLLAEQYSPLLYISVFIGVTVLVAFSYFRSQDEDMGTTTEFSLLITFILGSMVYTGAYHLSVTVAVIVTGLLALKLRLHEAVQQLSQHDIYSILYFVIITALVLPLLPDQDLGPYGVFNLYKIWLIVSIFVALNVLAYFLSKFIDRKRSVLLTGILGGFASSTATAWYFSRQSGKARSGGRIQAAAILFASSIMFPRLLVWLLLFNLALFNQLWLVITGIGAIGLLIGYFISRQKEEALEASGQEIDNPINLKEALIFAVIYIVIQLLVGYAGERYGEEGIWIAAAISGITDIDAITISMADYGQEATTRAIAAIAVLIAAFANTLVKYGFCLLFGNAQMRKYATIGFVPLFVLALAYILYLWV